MYIIVYIIFIVNVRMYVIIGQIFVLQWQTRFDHVISALLEPANDVADS